MPRLFDLRNQVEIAYISLEVIIFRITREVRLIHLFVGPTPILFFFNKLNDMGSMVIVANFLLQQLVTF